MGVRTIGRFWTAFGHPGRTGSRRIKPVRINPLQLFARRGAHGRHSNKICGKRPRGREFGGKVSQHWNPKGLIASILSCPAINSRRRRPTSIRPTDGGSIQSARARLGVRVLIAALCFSLGDIGDTHIQETKETTLGLLSPMSPKKGWAMSPMSPMSPKCLLKMSPSPGGASGPDKAVTGAD
jgi:hypothetical protein